MFWTNWHFSERRKCLTRFLLLLCFVMETAGLTHFMPLVTFYTPWTHQKTSGFLICSGGIERASDMKWIKAWRHLACPCRLWCWCKVRRRCSLRKSVLRNFAKFTGKQLCQSLFLNKVPGLKPATFWKGDSDTSVFLWILQNF